MNCTKSHRKDLQAAGPSGTASTGGRLILAIFAILLSCNLMIGMAQPDFLKDPYVDPYGMWSNTKLVGEILLPKPLRGAPGFEIDWLITGVDGPVHVRVSLDGYHIVDRTIKAATSELDPSVRLIWLSLGSTSLASGSHELEAVIGTNRPDRVSFEAKDVAQVIVNAADPEQCIRLLGLRHSALRDMNGMAVIDVSSSVDGRPCIIDTKGHGFSLDIASGEFYPRPDDTVPAEELLLWGGDDGRLDGSGERDVSRSGAESANGWRIGDQRLFVRKGCRLVLGAATYTWWKGGDERAVDLWMKEDRIPDLSDGSAYAFERETLYIGFGPAGRVEEGQGDWGRLSGSVGMLSLETGEFSWLQHPYPGPVWVNDIGVDHLGRLWVVRGGGGGLGLGIGTVEVTEAWTCRKMVVSNEGLNRALDERSPDTAVLDTGGIVAVAFDASGSAILLTEKGLYRHIDPGWDAMQPLWFGQMAQPYCIRVLEDNTILIGTLGHGCIIWDYPWHRARMSGRGQGEGGHEGGQSTRKRSTVNLTEGVSP